MRRLPAILLATLVVALPAQAADPTPRVKNTKGEIESMAMDGPRVAYAVKSDTCTKVIVLNVLTRSAVVASGRKTCDADNSSTGSGVREIAFAGTRLAWIVNQGGNSESDDYLYTATLGVQRERLVASAFQATVAPDSQNLVAATSAVVPGELVTCGSVLVSQAATASDVIVVNTRRRMGRDIWVSWWAGSLPRWYRGHSINRAPHASLTRASRAQNLPPAHLGR